MIRMRMQMMEGRNETAPLQPVLSGVSENTDELWAI